MFRGWKSFSSRNRSRGCSLRTSINRADHIVSKTIPPLRPRMKGQGHLAQIVHEFRQRFLGIDPVFPIKAIILRKKGHLFGS